MQPKDAKLETASPYILANKADAYKNNSGTGTGTSSLALATDVAASHLQHAFCLINLRIVGQYRLESAPERRHRACQDSDSVTSLDLRVRCFAFAVLLFPVGLYLLERGCVTVFVLAVCISHDGSISVTAGAITGREYRQGIETVSE